MEGQGSTGDFKQRRDFSGGKEATALLRPFMTGIVSISGWEAQAGGLGGGGHEGWGTAQEPAFQKRKVP